MLAAIGAMAARARLAAREIVDSRAYSRVPVDSMERATVPVDAGTALRATAGVAAERETADVTRSGAGAAAERGTVPVERPAVVVAVAVPLVPAGWAVPRILRVCGGLTASDTPRPVAATVPARADVASRSAAPRAGKTATQKAAIKTAGIILMFYKFYCIVFRCIGARGKS